MPSGGEGSHFDAWREAAASNRERINSLEYEVKRLRERQHEMAEDTAVVKYLAEQVKNLAGDVKTMSAQVSKAVSRPTAAVVGQYLAVVVSIVALVIVALR